MAEIIYFPFNAEPLGSYGADGEMQYDRVYDAESFAKRDALFFEDGVFPNPSNNLKVEAGNNLIVSVSEGAGFINGYTFMLFDGIYDLPLNRAHTTYPRKDLVVLQLNKTERLIELIIKTGTPATTPITPSLRRDADIYELKLAEITIPKGLLSISAANILDTRHDSNVCGIVSHKVDSVDTTELFNQYYTYLQEQIELWNIEKAKQQIDYYNWFGSLQTDLIKTIQFDFNNLASMPGSTKTTIFETNGNITETIVQNLTDLNVAKKETVFEINGNITVIETVFKEDGETIMKKIKTVTIFNNDGSIREEIINT